MNGSNLTIKCLDSFISNFSNLVICFFWENFSKFLCAKKAFFWKIVLFFYKTEKLTFLIEIYFSNHIENHFFPKFKISYIPPDSLTL